MNEPTFRLLVLLAAAGCLAGGYAMGMEAMRAASISRAKFVAGAAALSLLMAAGGFVAGWLL